MDQRDPARFGHMMARQYTLQDGLAGMLIEDIYQDRRGLLWIATADGGVSRFDGEAFENFGPTDGLPDFAVMTIAEDADGRLWFGTLGGAGRLRRPAIPDVHHRARAAVQRDPGPAAAGRWLHAPPHGRRHRSVRRGDVRGQHDSRRGSAPGPRARHGHRLDGHDLAGHASPGGHQPGRPLPESGLCQRRCLQLGLEGGLVKRCVNEIRRPS